MATSMKIEGTADLNRAMQKISADAERYVSDAVNATGIELRGDIVKRYKTKGTGRIYTHYFFTDGSGRLRKGRKRNKPHQASAPGEAPAIDGGRLASSVVFSRAGRLSAEVETKVSYGPMLEFGTQKIAMRPAWRPAVEAMQPKFQKRLEAALRKAMKT